MIVAEMALRLIAVEERVGFVERVVDVRFNLRRPTIWIVGWRMILLVANIFGIAHARGFLSADDPAIHDGEFLLSALLHPIGCPAFFLDPPLVLLSAAPDWRIFGLVHLVLRGMREFALAADLGWLLRDVTGASRLVCSTLGAAISQLLIGRIPRGDAVVAAIAFFAIAFAIAPDEQEDACNIAPTVFLVLFFAKPAVQLLRLLPAREEFEPRMFASNAIIWRAAMTLVCCNILRFLLLRVDHTEVYRGAVQVRAARLRAETC